MLQRRKLCVNKKTRKVLSLVKDTCDIKKTLFYRLKYPDVQCRITKPVYCLIIMFYKYNSIEWIISVANVQLAGCLIMFFFLYLKKIDHLRKGTAILKIKTNSLLFDFLQTSCPLVEKKMATKNQASVIFNFEMLQQSMMMRNISFEK